MSISDGKSQSGHWLSGWPGRALHWRHAGTEKWQISYVDQVYCMAQKFALCVRVVECYDFAVEQ